jgi:hypothetical protein
MERFEEMKESQRTAMYRCQRKEHQSGQRKQKGNPVHISEERCLDQKNIHFLGLPTILRQYIFLGLPGFKKIQHNIVF